MKNKQFKIIAGPCAVESEGQITAIAKGIADIVQKSSNQSKVFSPIKYLRGGIWKPRTRPNMFEGLGEVALPWLYNAAVKHNMIPITEVGTAAQLAKAIAGKVDNDVLDAAYSGTTRVVGDTLAKIAYDGIVDAVIRYSFKHFATVPIVKRVSFCNALRNYIDVVNNHSGTSILSQAI